MSASSEEFAILAQGSLPDLKALQRTLEANDIDAKLLPSQSGNS